MQNTNQNPRYFCWVRFAQSLYSLYNVVWIFLVVFFVVGFLSFFLWSMSVFRLFTASDYPFDNFKLFSNWGFFVVKTPGISVVFVLPNMYLLGVMSCGSLFVFCCCPFPCGYCIVCPSPRFTTSDYSIELVSHSFFLWSSPYYFILSCANFICHA